MKDISHSSIINEYLNAVKAANTRQPVDPTVKNLSLGQEFHTTGRLMVAKESVNGSLIAYIAVETKEGILLPIKSLMGISSLYHGTKEPYYTEGEYVSESIDGNNKVEEIIQAKVVADFDFSKVFQPSTRQLLKFIEEVERHNFFEEKIIRYLGMVVRPYIAARNSSPASLDKYEAGMKRAIASQLWEIKDTQEGLRRKAQEEEERIKREALLKKELEEIERRNKEIEKRRELNHFNERNKHYRDAFLNFEEKTHKYIADGLILQSVTNFVEGCFPKFDAELHARPVAARMGLSTKEVISMWEQKGLESRTLGTAMHQKIEKYLKGESYTDDDTFRLFRIFADRTPLNPYRTEWAIFDFDHKIAGTIDYVDCQSGKYTIYDWKRSDKIIVNGMPMKTSKYQEKGLPPIEHLDNCTYWHYALQLSLYKFILERNYDIKVDALRLGIFHPTYEKPYVLNMPYLDDEIRQLMNLRSEVLL
ncbi:MAG: hypothetical protein J5932_03500 [Prevotella sp.]|nr:hypothetical protein [Prevotella sp.]